MKGFFKKSQTALNDTRKVQETYETSLLGDSLEMVLSKKSNFLLLSGSSELMSWLTTAVFIMQPCSFL
ncbi:hypothetical protein XENORESO_006240 [Xenotaenia resolanae]|uniref:Uncharacterized protein n=1 Tax=Xenotaenia resolanae TaxID=208358 RepID=A0ABV0WSR2_9TELE